MSKGATLTEIHHVRHRLGKWLNKHSDVTHAPPDGAPSPSTIERWEREYTEFAAATRWCAGCYKGEYCQYHQEAKDKMHEYQVEEIPDEDARDDEEES